MPVRGSESYVWFSEQTFGVTNGKTYFGRNKISGSPCVIKLTTESSLSKQLDKFKKISSKNVAKFLGTEYTKNTEKLVVFEYCDEHCLLKYLEKPDNAYGLNDNDTIQLMDNVISGLQDLVNIGLPINYLLKPSNILCARDSDGGVIFKISDYVYAAYESDIYFINIIDDRVNILIWSVGAILCHVILGMVPFGTSEQSESVKLIMKKENDHIFISSSGQWQSLFPQTICLNLSLQRTFINIIRSCLNLTNQIDLKKFFSYKFCSSDSDVVVYAFDPSSLQHIAIICNSDSAINIEDSIKNTQTLIFDYKILKVTDLCLIRDRISEKEPVIIYTPEFEPKIKEYKQILDDAYAQKTSSDDLSFTRKCNGFIIFCLRLFEKIVLSKKGLKQICNVLTDELSVKMDTIKLKLDTLKSFQQNLCDNLFRRYEELRNRIHELKVFGASDYKHSEEVDSGLGASWLSSMGSKSDSCNDATTPNQCHGILKELVEQTTKTYDIFLQDTNKELSHNEIQVHKYEIVKLKEHAKKAYQLLKCQIQISSDTISKFKKIICEVYSLCDSAVVDKFDREINIEIPLQMVSDFVNSSDHVSEHGDGRFNANLNIINELIKKICALIIDFDDKLDKIT